MATLPVTLLNGTTADADDVMDDFIEIYANINNSNIAAAAGIVFSKLDSTTVAGRTAIQTLTNKTLTAAVFTGNTTFDTTTLFVDSVNHRVGEGTITPECLSHLFVGAGSGGAIFAGTVQKIESNANAYQEFETTTANNAGLVFTDDVSARAWWIYDHSTDSFFARVAGVAALTLSSAGLGVGVGASTVASALQIIKNDNGNSIARFQNTNATQKKTYLQLSDSTGALTDALIGLDTSTGVLATSFLYLGIGAAAAPLKVFNSGLVTMTSGLTVTGAVSADSFSTGGDISGRSEILGFSTSSGADTSVLSISGNNAGAGGMSGIYFTTSLGTLDKQVFRFAATYTDTTALGAFYGRIPIFIDGVGIKYISLYS